MSNPIVEKVPSAKSRKLPIFAEFDEIADKIRDRAFSVFKDRGFEDGHALDHWLEAERQLCWPAPELVENDKEIDIEVALAGFNADEIVVTATPEEIIVKAAHESSKKEKDEGKEMVTHFSEFRSNKVFRHFQLPASIKVSDVEAKYRNGILKIEAPKAKGASKKERKVKVKPAG